MFLEDLGPGFRRMVGKESEEQRKSTTQPPQSSLFGECVLEFEGTTQN